MIGTASDIQSACIDGNEAAARVAYALSEVIAIYPITPASPMGEHADDWAAANRPNRWGLTPDVIEMQSEAGAAGALHGALQKGALATTFTASQGLLLMVPNMFKIAGELTPCVIHVAARTIATHALSIFGDHSDVMHARTTGWAMLAASSVQEAHDFALVSHAATLRARVPFLHFFDGFRTSHEVDKIELLDDSDLGALVRDRDVVDHRLRGMTPDAPTLRGTAQNPDVFFQAREAANPYYDAVPGHRRRGLRRARRAHRSPLRTRRLHRRARRRTGDRVDGVGGRCGDRDRGSPDRSGREGGSHHDPLVSALPRGSVARCPAVDDAGDRRARPHQGAGRCRRAAVSRCVGRTRRGGGNGRPSPRRGHASSDRRTLRPGVQGDHAVPRRRRVQRARVRCSPRPHFTVGIYDDVTRLSLEPDRSVRYARPPGEVQAMFFGLGSDGTVGANKSSIKIIGEQTELFAQGYFVYDSKKAGSVTVSHLRFGPEPIRSTYLIDDADFVACHQFGLLEKLKVLEYARPGATFLLNCPWGPDEVWDHLPMEVQRELIAKRIDMWVIDAQRVAREAQMGNRVNTVMQPCFFALSGVLPTEQAIGFIKAALEKTYGSAGHGDRRAQLRRDRRIARGPAPRRPSGDGDSHGPARAPAARRRTRVRASASRRSCSRATVICCPCRRSPSTVSSRRARPSTRSVRSRRRSRSSIPDICIDCGRCAAVCPHATIRMKVYDPTELAGAPDGFRSKAFRSKDVSGMAMTIQVAPDDCTGCGVCVDVCPAKSKSEVKHKAINMEPAADHRDAERLSWDFFLTLPEIDRDVLPHDSVKGSQALQPLFEFSGACAGCGETPYIKLVTQLFGDRMIVANATGCSSIYGANLPTTPWTTNSEGRGPAWNNSLFEDNAEFGLGIRLGYEAQQRQAQLLVEKLAPLIGVDLAAEILAAEQSDEPAIRAQRERVAALRAALSTIGHTDEHRRRRDPSRVGRRCPREEGRLDHRWRRVGLRHRLRWPRPRLVERSERQHPRPRHRGVLQHRRTGFQGDPPQRSRQVHRRRKGRRQEGLGRDRPRLRQRLRRADRDRGQRHADHEGARRGRGLARPQPCHRLLDVHRPRNRHVAVDEPHERRRAIRVLAAVPLLAVRRGAWHAVPPRLQGSRRSPSRSSSATEARFAVLKRTHPERAAELGALLQADADERWRYYSQLVHRVRTDSPAVAPRGPRTTTMTDLTTRYLGSGAPHARSWRRRDR